MERPDLKQALGRLLGPDGPEIGCDECFEQLDRYGSNAVTRGVLVGRRPGLTVPLLPD